MMDGLTHVYCVRHALPVLSADDRGRPLTEEGRADALRAAEFLREVSLDCAVSSPYVRSVDTIRPAAAEHGLTIRKIEDFRERTCGDTGGETAVWLRRRWEDFDAAEPHRLSRLISSGLMPFADMVMMLLIWLISWSIADFVLL